MHESGEMRSFLERFVFPYLTHTPNYAPIFLGKVAVALMYSMNIKEVSIACFVLDKAFAETHGLLSRVFGNCELLLSTDTLQFNDYAKYLTTAWDPAARPKGIRMSFRKTVNAQRTRGATCTKGYG